MGIEEMGEKFNKNKAHSRTEVEITASFFFSCYQRDKLHFFSFAHFEIIKRRSGCKTKNNSNSQIL
jgi:hypothetical protein